MPGTVLIAVIVEPGSWGNRQLIEGIAAYSQQRAPWRLALQECTANGAVDKWLLRARLAGVIAEITSRSMAKTLQRMGVPIVDVLEEHPTPRIPAIVCDDQKIIRQAVDHLLQRGLRHVAFLGERGRRFAEQRRMAFCEIAQVQQRPRAHSGHVLQAAYSSMMLPARSLLPSGAAELADWLRSLPKPLGLVACNDVWGAQALRVCSEHGLRVPDDVAVIGVDDDPVFCQMSDPPLSSISCNAHAMGYQAAAMLHEMVSQGRSPPPLTLIEPGPVQSRGSTDILAIPDAAALAAVRFLREHACAGTTTDIAAARLRISRSTLERMVKGRLGHSPAAEITRVRLERARELIVATDLPLSDVAHRSGVPHVETLHRLFKKRYGFAPGAYRRAHGSGSTASAVALRGTAAQSSASASRAAARNRE